MTEELVVMDKKNFLTPTPKCLTQEPSRSSSRQDGPGGNLLARKPQPRRRDVPVGSANGPAPKLDISPRKPPPQKSKIMDKRSRPRLNTNPRQVGDDSETEMGFIPTTGGKKQNFNHLLNFHFAPREGRNLWRSFNTHPGGSWQTRSRTTQGNVLRPKFNKEHFLQANCQFLVKADGDYTVYDFDPDILVAWNMIEQINIRITGENPVCPICLSPPAGAKMTRCGHIFCWPCILHYLALSDNKSRSCPICYDQIAHNDLKSVVANVYRDNDVGDEVSMQLMIRAKDSAKAMPLVCKSGAGFNWENSYSKLLPTTPVEVLDKIIDRERSELRIRLKEDEHCPEVCFVHQAMNQLATRRNILLKEMAEAYNSPIPEASAPTITVASVGLQGLAMPVTRNRTESGGSGSSEQNGGTKDIFASKSVEVDGFSYFYQAEDGQNIFLHPLNMAMLWKGFGPDPTNWPQTIHVKVVEKEYITMCSEERKRYRFLKHLPITTCFQLIEVEVKSPMISHEVLKEFEAQLAQRQKRRSERVRKERKREELLEEEERKRNAPLPRPKIESNLDFPPCGTQEEYEFQHALLASLAESPLENFFDQKPEENLSGNSEKTKKSFIDREWKSLESDYPSLRTEDSDGHAPGSSHMSFAQAAANPSTGRSIATISPASTRPVVGKVGTEKADGDAESEEYSVPNFRISVSDAIAKALATHEEDEQSVGNSTASQKKKGRKKGKVLFATGGVGNLGSN